jgi:hypothetical protein
MAVVLGKRRGRGEDSIYWDDAKSLLRRCSGVAVVGAAADTVRRHRKSATPISRNTCRTNSAMGRERQVGTVCG